MKEVSPLLDLISTPDAVDWIMAQKANEGFLSDLSKAFTDPEHATRRLEDVITTTLNKDEKYQEKMGETLQEWEQQGQAVEVGEIGRQGEAEEPEPRTQETLAAAESSEEPRSETGEVTIKIATLNVCSLAAAATKRKLLQYLATTTADVVCLQETMITREQERRSKNTWRTEAALHAINRMGWRMHVAVGTRQQGGYGGVATLSREQPIRTDTGPGTGIIAEEGRFLAAVYEDVIVVNVYAPTLSMDLEGMDRKKEFWRDALMAVRQLRNEFPEKNVVWAGDVNVVQEQRDIHEKGIRQLLRDHAKPGQCLPGTTEEERRHFRGILREAKVVDAFTQMELQMRERRSPRARFTHYATATHQKQGFGARLDVLLTSDGIHVVTVEVLTQVRVSDHLPVEGTFQLRTGETERWKRKRQVGRETRRHRDPEWSQKTKWKPGDRVRVDTTAVRGETPDGHEWVPATVRVVTRGLVLVAIDPRWYNGKRPSQGVEPNDITKLETCPARWGEGDEVTHRKTKRRGTVQRVLKEGGLNSKDHEFEVLFEGDNEARSCKMETLRNPPEERNPAADLTSTSERATTDVMEVVATMMAGDTARTGEDGYDAVCTCESEARKAKKENANLPSVPYTRDIKVEGKAIRAMVDTGAFDGLVRAEWLDTNVPSWKDRLTTRGATAMKFKLADGTSSTTPAGRLRVHMDVKGKGQFWNLWVVRGLSADLIIGAKVMDCWNAQINMKGRLITFKDIPGEPTVEFELRRHNQWRAATSIMTAAALTLAPRETRTIEGRVDGEGMKEVHEKERAHGAIDGTEAAAQAGIVVFPAVGPIDGHEQVRKGGKWIEGTARFTIQNHNDWAVTIPCGMNIAEFSPKNENQEKSVPLLSRDGLELYNKLIKRHEEQWEGGAVNCCWECSKADSDLGGDLEDSEQSVERTPTTDGGAEDGNIGNSGRKDGPEHGDGTPRVDVGVHAGQLLNKGSGDELSMPKGQRKGQGAQEKAECGCPRYKQPPGADLHGASTQLLAGGRGRLAPLDTAHAATGRGSELARGVVRERAAAHDCGVHEPAKSVVTDSRNTSQEGASTASQEGESLVRENTHTHTHTCQHSPDTDPGNLH